MITPNLWMFPYLEVRIFADKIKLRWGHIGLDGAFIQWLVSLVRERNLDTETQKGKINMWKQRQRLEFCCHKPRNSKDCLQPPEDRTSKEGIVPRAFTESMALLAPWFSTSSFQNCERINPCCFQPPSLWSLFYSHLSTEMNTSYVIKTSLSLSFFL